MYGPTSFDAAISFPRAEAVDAEAAEKAEIGGGDDVRSDELGG